MTPRSKKISEQMRAESRAALLSAARKLFAQKGYFNCAVSEIAHEAGMSQGNVYWYFSSKEALLQAVLTEGFEMLGALFEDSVEYPGTSVEKLDYLIDRLIDFARQRGDFNTILLSLLGHGGAELLLTLGFSTSEIGVGYTHSVSRILAQGQAQGSLSADMPPEVLAMFLFSLFNGLTLTYGQEWTGLPQSYIREATKRLLGYLRDPI